MKYSYFMNDIVRSIKKSSLHASLGGWSFLLEDIKEENPLSFLILCSKQCKKYNMVKVNSLLNSSDVEVCSKISLHFDRNIAFGTYRFWGETYQRYFDLSWN